MGVDRIVAESGVAKMTLYRNFGSKDELALEFLRLRERRWAYDWLLAGIESRALAPADRLLAIFDLFDTWFRQADYEGCAFINVMLEMTDPEDEARQVSVTAMATLRSYLQGLAAEAGVADAEDFAHRWHILMKGAILSAAEGDLDAARRAQEMGRLLLANATATA